MLNAQSVEHVHLVPSAADLRKSIDRLPALMIAVFELIRFQTKRTTK